jgi:hypothetical protein
MRLMLIVMLAGCSVADRRVVVEITNVPPGTTSLVAHVTADHREVVRTFSGSDLSQVQNGRTSVALAISHDASGPIDARVQALAGTCAIADKSVRCDPIDSCDTIAVALEAAASCGMPSDGGTSDGGGDGVVCGAVTCAGATPICCQTMGGGASSCSNDVSCNGRVPVSCDAPGDCASGSACCATDDHVACGHGGCSATEITVCSGAADCPLAAPSCCPYRFGLRACAAASC